MKSKYIFNTFNSELRNHSLNINVSKNKKEISEINYYFPNGNKEKSFEIRNWHDSSIIDKEIIKMGILLLKYGAFQEFFNLYNEINNKKIKSLLNDSINELLERYSILKLSGTGELKLDNKARLNYYNGNYFISTRDKSLHKSMYEISLDPKIKEILATRVYSKYKNPREYLEIYEYNRDTIASISEYPRFINPLSKSRVIDFSYKICQSDLVEYRRLIETISKRDKYYNSVIEGAKNYIGDIEILSKSLK